MRDCQIEVMHCMPYMCKQPNASPNPVQMYMYISLDGRVTRITTVVNSPVFLLFV